jgi:hypothetical protein
MRIDDKHADSWTSDAEFATWHVYDAGGPRLCLKVRSVEGSEIADWQNGPDIFAALDLAEAQGWRAYDREPGNAPAEYAILHLKREHPMNGPSR